LPDLATILLLVPPILAALTFHEYAHGWVAYKLGDPTAKIAGRLTLNPLAHLDPVGAIMLFLFYFGWAKPVPVNPYNLRSPKTDMIWVSLAGPGANILLAAILAVIIKPLLNYGLIDLFGIMYKMLTLAVFINLMLAFFNLLPVPPLDGSKVVAGLLPDHCLKWWGYFEMSGPFVLISLIILGRLTGVSVFGSTIFPLANGLYVLFTGGLPVHL